MELDVSIPRIEPVRSALPVGERRLETAEIRLHGIPRGCVLVLCEPGALRDRVSDPMNALAEHGYETLAVDLGDLALDDGGALAVVEDLLGHLATWGWQHEQIGVLGYAGGGRVALLAATRLVLGAAISLSPGAVLDVDVARLRTPWLAVFGATDEGVTSVLPVLAERSARAAEFAQVVTYPGVGADFYLGSASSLGHMAAFDSWQRVVEWLNTRVVPRPSPYAELWAARRASGDA